MLIMYLCVVTNTHAHIKQLVLHVHESIDPMVKTSGTLSNTKESTKLGFCCPYPMSFELMVGFTPPYTACIHCRIYF